MPEFDDPDQEAKDHGNLMDEGVAEVEREANEAAGGQNHRLAGKETEPVPPIDRPIGAAEFSEAQMAEEDSDARRLGTVRRSPLTPTGGATSRLPSYSRNR